MDRIAIITLTAAAAAACGEEKCPPGTAREGGQCVLVDGDADSDSDSDSDSDTGTDCEGGEVFYADGDDDGFGDPSDTVCVATDGYVADGGDCDDADGDVHPGAAEACNGVDDDCANGPDDGFDCVLGDVNDCEDTPCGSIGSSTCEAGCVVGLCDPPEETCNGEDDDCDGLVDQNLYTARDPVQLSTAAGDELSPDVAWTGDAWFVVWEDDELAAGHSVRFTVVRDDAADPPGGDYFSEVSGESRLPRIAAFGGQVAMTLSGTSGPDAVIVGCAVDPAAPKGYLCTPPLHEIGVGAFAELGYASAIAASADQFVIGWVNDVNRALPVDAVLTRLDATPDEIGTETVIGAIPALPPSAVSVAYDPAGDVFVLAWARDADVWAGQMDGDGALVGASVRVANDAVNELYGPAVAWSDAGEGVLVYGSALGGGAATTLRMQPLDEGADAAGSAVDLMDAAMPDHRSGADAVWNGSEYAVVSPASTEYDGVAEAVDVVRFQPDSRTSQAQTSISAAAATTVGSHAAIAWSGTEYALVWTDDSAGGDQDVWFRRFSCE